jgi:hypothetical protein
MEGHVACITGYYLCALGVFLVGCFSQSDYAVTMESNADFE